MVTFSKPCTTNKPQSNGPQEIKPIVPIEKLEAQELTKGEYHMYKLCTVPYNANSSSYDLAILFYDTGSVEKWLKFWQNLQAVITGQNITNAQ
eukprot:3884545-Ditylum_brightwellii.AAC.1